MKKENVFQEESDATESAGCCGGAPVKNEAACCKLDEEKKEEGLAGCGCSTSPRATCR